LRKTCKPTVFGAAVGLAVLISAGCAVRRTTRVSPGAVPPPPVETSADNLVDRLNTARDSIRTLSATVELEPTAGSVYSGVINQYHDVRAFILLQAPDHIRMIGQAPVVRTTIFDMASDGKEFRVWVPSRRKFIVGNTGASAAGKNSLENLRPQHILEALLVPAVNREVDTFFMNQEREGARTYDVLNVVLAKPAGQGPERFELARKVWFDGASLELTRVEFYDAKGALAEDVRYADDQDYQGVRYPSHIKLERPAEDYSLGITVQKATFNEAIAADKFVLAKPAGAEQIDVGASGGGAGGQ